MRALWLIPLLTILAVPGCSRISRATQASPPDYLEVVGVGRAQGEGSGPASWGQTMGAAIAATAEADLKTSDTSPAVVMAMRAASRRGALRKLADQLQEAPLDSKTKLREWLQGAPPDQRMGFENLIEERSTVAWRDQAGRSIAVASIPTSVVSAWVLEHARSGDEAKTGAADPAALNLSAYNNAVQDARAKLRERLLGMDVGDGRTMSKVIEDNPSIKIQLDSIIHVVPVDEVNYPSVGNCQVKVFFDRNVARGLAAQDGRSWFGLFKR
ncbi:MAG: hypothetical protein ABFD69_05205 [Candidatus Sumerlaeia bacterium]